MRRKVQLLMAIFLISTNFYFLVSCDYSKEIIHLHNYTNSIVEERFLKSSATCKSRAQYYKSCDCGEIGAEYFEYGEIVDHYYVKGKCKWCKKEEVKIMVWISKTGSKYHIKQKCGNIIYAQKVSIFEAKLSGYEPCKNCYR